MSVARVAKEQERKELSKMEIGSASISLSSVAAEAARRWRETVDSNTRMLIFAQILLRKVAMTILSIDRGTILRKNIKYLFSFFRFSVEPQRNCNRYLDPECSSASETRGRESGPACARKSSALVAGSRATGLGEPRRVKAMKTIVEQT